jgi:Rrf2 family nitric oxide-sensitive transcriptional repressor
MRLTTLTDYALRLLMHVAQQPDRLCTIAEVAQHYGISEAHLTKVTHRLALGGWIETVRGKGGGMRLARPAQDIGLGAVVRDMESDFAIVECFGTDGQCALEGHCRLAGILGAALAQFHQHLDRHTLQDLLPRPRPSPAAPARVALRREA